MRKSGGGRIVNVVSRQALEWRLGSGVTAYAASRQRWPPSLWASRKVIADGILVNAVAPFDHRHAGQPGGDAQGRSRRLGCARGDRGNGPMHLASPANAVTRGAIVPVYGRA